MHNTCLKGYQPFIALMMIMLSISGCGVRSDGMGDGAGDNRNTGNYAAAIDSGSTLLARPTPRSCSLADVNGWVYQSMQDYYLFYDQVDPNIDATDAESPEALISSLRVAPNDTFSYVTDETGYNAFFNDGETFGYGWNFARDASDTLLFSLVEPDSPLAKAGVKRGDQLLSINGIDISDFDRLSTMERQEIIGRTDEVKTITLGIASTDSTKSDVTVTRSRYSLKTVLDARVLRQNGLMVGYLHFYQFINTSSAELQEAFAMFKAAGISELVVDLRFNGGGRIYVANELASHIVGQYHTDDVFTTFAYNDKYSNRNVSLYFQYMLSGVSLNRVFVLQSKNTCSASELVVNSLRPYMEVITVGTTSCGKPYATTPNTACGKVMNALELELLNADNAGGYYDGITADCPAVEDVAHPLGDASEPLLATALNYINTGSCSLMAKRSGAGGQDLTSDFKLDWQGGNTLQGVMLGIQ